MSDEILSDGVNEFLNQVESYLCLPILILMILCTLHFIINHVIDFGLSIACACIDDNGPDIEPDTGENCEPFSGKN